MDFSYILISSNYVEDDVVNEFHAILSRHTVYRPRALDYILCPSKMNPVASNETHLQVVFSGEDLSSIGHWACVFYNGEQLRVYDSLPNKNISDLLKRYVAALLPHHPVPNFVEVQRQTNLIDCGLFAIAFATSLALQKNPAYENYVVSEMRPHLLRILETGQLLPFPSQSRKPRGRPQKQLFLKSKTSIEVTRVHNMEKKRRMRANKNNKLENSVTTDDANYLSSDPILTASSITSTRPTKNKRSKTDIRENNLENKRRSRSHIDVSQREKYINRLQKQRIRNNTRYKQRVQSLNTETRRVTRSDPTYRREEQSRDTELHRLARCDPNNRQKEQLRDAEAHRLARCDPDYRQEERARDAEAHSILRCDPDYRQEERARDAEAHSLLRCDPDYRQEERARDVEAHCLLRCDLNYRQEEQSRDAKAHRLARCDHDYRREEQSRDAEAHRVARCNTVYKENEQVRNTEARRGNRLDEEYLVRERSLHTLRGKTAVWENVVKKFRDNIKEGSTNPCHCCGRLWHKRSITTLSKSELRNKGARFTEEYLLKVFHLHSNAEIGYFCHTCKKYIKECKIPRLARQNGLVFPDIPDVLSNLTALEERLVCPRHIFLKIIRKGTGLGFQHGLEGNVINVPVEINTMVTALPRSHNDNHIITVELKRKMCYKHGRKERIRPEKVWQAARYLVSCELFKELKIQVDENWIEGEEDELGASNECTCHLIDQDRYPEEDNLNPGGQETLLDEDITLIMAPGEGKRPMSLVYDEHMEEMAFVKIHCGQKRIFSIKLNHMEIIKSEITREDRRAVRPDYLFTALKKQQMICVRNSIATCLRKKTINGAPIIAENVLDNNFIDNLVQVDDGYKILKGIKNSPAHWEGEKKKLLAMVRQFGVPTLFITLSAAETHWPELLRILKKVVDKELVSLEEAENLPYNTKARLIQSDPYICATYFDLRLQEVRKTWRSTSGPFNAYDITHFYYRIEFQHRGSPHAHIMLWLDGAPMFQPGDSCSKNSVEQFIDEMISCSSDGIDDILCGYQTHKHTHTCHPKPGKPCRFGIPFFPMDRTEVLMELDKKYPTYKDAKELSVKLRTQLENLPSHVITFEDFLNHVNMTRDEYILAVRASLSRPKVILQRRPTDIYVNPYCKKILTLHRANMDAQYILDPFACSIYIVNYINKADRGMSRLLRAAVEETRQGNRGIRECLRQIANVFLNSSEISAQEAIYYLLSLPMSRASESEIFINTSPPDKRVHLLKSLQDLRLIDPQSADIFLPNLIDHYINRPNTPEFDNMCLAFFAAYYTYAKKKTTRLNEISEELPQAYNDDIDDDQNEEIHNGNWVGLLRNDGYVRRRTRPRIIRFCRYSRVQDADMFFREQIMLYLPWRNEHTELLNPDIDLKSKFTENQETIKSESIPFNKLGGADEFESLLQALKDAEKEKNNDDEDEEGIRCGRGGDVLEGFDYENQIGDVANDLVPGGNVGINQGDNIVAFAKQPPPLNEDQFLELTRNLNKEQRNILLHVTHYFQTSSSDVTPLNIFISGGAGVGKSVLINALYQSLTQHFNREPGSNPDDLKILLSAPTGKAAYGIGGQTLHSALGLPVSQAGYSMPDLSPSVANTLSSKFANLKLIIIDEISMVGSRTFFQINRRLQQIFHKSTLFGGISVIVVGDFGQLSPVGDNWIFQPNYNNPLAVLAGAPLWEKFILYELKTVMRQRDDLRFAIALNNLARGHMTDEDMDLMQSRTYKLAEIPADAKDAIHLYSTNRDVDLHNERALSLMTTEGAIVLAIDTVSGENNPKAKEKALDSVNSLPTAQTYGLTKRLVLKLSARYMITVNVDTSDGLVNGNTGRLKCIDFGINISTGERRPLRLWLEFDTPDAGKNKRNAMICQNSIYRKRLQNMWTPLESVSYTIKKWKASNLQVRRTQFPLVPAEAITVHKSQGATMDKVVVHLNKHFKRAMTYVACSRAKTAQGLFIVSEQGFLPPPRPTDTNPVIVEMSRMRELVLVPKFMFLSEERPTHEIQVYFHNVQSLRKHLPDVAADPIATSSDILILVETWSCSQDSFVLNNFLEIARTNGPKSNGANPGFGSIALTRNNALHSDCSSSGKQFISGLGGIGHCEGVYFDLCGVRFIGIYRSPQCPTSVLIQALDAVLFESNNDRNAVPPTVLCGDFNEDFLRTNDTTLIRYIRQIGLKCVLPAVSTTRRNTQIDNIFSNITVTAGLSESLFSYHRPLWIRIDMGNTQV